MCRADIESHSRRLRDAILRLLGGGSTVSIVTGAAGVGLATLASDGSILDTWFPAPELIESCTSATSRLAVSDVPPELAALIGRDDDRNTETIAVRTVIGSLDEVAADAYDA